MSNRRSDTQGARTTPATQPEWSDFLRDYSGFLLGCIRRFTTDPDERMDMYAHVCSRLRADNCRRLRQFRGYGDEGACKFTTWLATVTLNLCREWIRVRRGRRRFYRSIERLSARHALVFKHRYWNGYTSSQILELVRPLGYATTVADVDRLIAEIEQHLSDDHRWRLLARRRSDRGADLSVAEETVAGGPGGEGSADVEVQVHRTWARAELRRAVRSLPADLRRVLELRYLEAWTARRVAAELGIRPYKRVYELQSRALACVRTELESAGVALSDLERALDPDGGRS